MTGILGKLSQKKLLTETVVSAIEINDAVGLIDCCSEFRKKKKMKYELD